MKTVTKQYNRYKSILYTLITIFLGVMIAAGVAGVINLTSAPEVVLLGICFASCGALMMKITIEEPQFIGTGRVIDKVYDFRNKKAVRCFIVSVDDEIWEKKYVSGYDQLDYLNRDFINIGDSVDIVAVKHHPNMVVKTTKED